MYPNCQISNVKRCPEGVHSGFGMPVFCVVRPQMPRILACTSAAHMDTLVSQPWLTAASANKQARTVPTVERALRHFGLMGQDPDPVVLEPASPNRLYALLHATTVSRLLTNYITIYSELMRYSLPVSLSESVQHRQLAT